MENAEEKKVNVTFTKVMEVGLYIIGIIFLLMKVCQKAHLLFLEKSPDFHKLGHCYYLKNLYL